MKKLLVVLMAALCLTACAGTITTPSSQPTAVTSAQDAAQKSLYAIGTALQATPGILDALYNAGKVSKTDYNKVVPVYNQALASYQLAVTALKAAVAAGQDPNTATAYVSALQTFLTDKTNIDNLLSAMGAQPIGTGVSK